MGTRLVRADWLRELSVHNFAAALGGRTPHEEHKPRRAGAKR